MRSAGMCGCISPDGKRICILDPGHEQPHPWDDADDDLELFEKLADTLESQNEHEQAMAAVGRVRERLDTLERERDDGLTTTRMPDSAAARMSYLEMEVERLRDGLRRQVDKRSDWPWWEQYEETAQKLTEKGEHAAADDIRTLVDGLRQHEREVRALLAVPSAHKPAKERGC